MAKPEFLYHGSRYKLDVLKPQQAYGSPDENGAEYGIYALENRDLVRPFTLTINPFENGSMAIYAEDDTGEVTIAAGTLDDHAVGYIYKVSSETFTKIDDRQWISKVDVIPLEVHIVETKDYLHKITFTASALEHRMKVKPSS